MFRHADSERSAPQPELNHDLSVSFPELQVDDHAPREQDGTAKQDWYEQMRNEAVLRAEAARRQLGNLLNDIPRLEAEIGSSRTDVRIKHAEKASAGADAIALRAEALLSQRQSKSSEVPAEAHLAKVIDITSRLPLIETNDITPSGPLSKDDSEDPHTSASA